MRTQVGEQQPSAAPQAQSLRLPAQATPGSISARAIVADEVRGTIHAAVQAFEECSYDALSKEWVREEPLRLVAPCEPFPHAGESGLRAKDLIAELNSINAQIHRMMFQVERAVSRLATSAAIS